MGELKTAPDGIAHEKTGEPEMYCPVSRFSLLGIVFRDLSDSFIVPS